MGEAELKLKTPEPWPIQVTGRDLRLRAARRRRRRMAMSASGLVAGVSVVMAYGPGLLGDSGTSVTDRAWVAEGTRANPVEFFGASVDLPAGWSLQPVDGPPAEHWACLTGDTATVSAESCELVLRVAADPARAITEVSDPLGVFVTRECQPGDPRIVTWEQLTVQARSASHYEVRCTEESAPTSFWQLDNRTVALVASGPDARAHAPAIFESLTVPPDWPEHKQEATTAETATPSSAGPTTPGPAAPTTPSPAPSPTPS